MKRIPIIAVSLVLTLTFALGACGKPAPQPVTPKPDAVVLPAPGSEAPAPAPAPAAEPAQPAAPTGEVTIYRDTWGVPHIYGTTPRDAAFGMGYAQAQDRLDDIYKNIRTATGTMAEVFGEEHVEMDYIVRLMRNAELCQKYWDEAPQEIRDLGDGYMDGVKAFIAEHPEKVPEFACDLYGWQCGAVGRLMILQWPLGTIQDELNRKGEEPP
ncbi:MAG: acyl-homoserine-lactone acylase, partial [Candidatus Hydrogenedentes bacterium]|nr:acyl-homoserine-lactone acylase [Candidatus Hydrogenedentota bacterium]